MLTNSGVSPCRYPIVRPLSTNIIFDAIEVISLALESVGGYRERFAGGLALMKIVRSWGCELVHEQLHDGMRAGGAASHPLPRYTQHVMDERKGGVPFWPLKALSNYQRL